MTARKRGAGAPAKAKASARSAKVATPAPRGKAATPTPSVRAAAPAPRAKTAASVAEREVMTPAPSVKVGAAKGRPMLSWVGKRPLREVPAHPAQEVERFSVPGLTADIDWSDWPDRYPRGGLLFHGDNKEVLAHLLANGFRGKVDLIYIDPPFDSGADYLRRIELRGVKGAARIDGEAYTLGEQIQYTDIWANDNYLQFMYERLLLLRELLAPDGSLYLHSDVHRSHHLRCLLEEVFGAANLRNEIIWKRFNFRADGKKFGTVHDTIFLVTKGSEYHFDKPFIDLNESYIKSHFRRDADDRLFRLDNLTAPAHGKAGRALRFGEKLIPPPPGTMWRHAQEGLDELWESGLIVIPDGGVPQVIRYLDEIEGQAVHSLWTDIFSINSQSGERTDFPTQKPESLLERILSTSSRPGSIVLDCFVGSGTTVAVAQKLGRRWLAADINKGAIQMTTKRLIESIEAQRGSGQGTLDLDDVARPAQLAFATYRVNDYDLAIQHNEAVALAVEALGATRTQTDRFFDGTHGKKLLKIVPFDHPASPADLDEIARELRARPGEERDVVAVALGKETTCDGWLATHNVRGAPNQIQLIELRTDPKYGKLFAHQPAKAKLTVKRDGKRAKVVIKEFISPTIVERLTAQEGIVAPRITDWRQMVDSVMIDPSYDGTVFEVALADVPEKKDDLVAGTYEVAIPKGTTTVAVKITDMLGEEVVVVVKV